jgi:hypothetical protein
MNAQELVAARLIGSLFVERGLVSESQIRVALEIQEKTDQQLGEILVERFGVSRAELAVVVAEQWQDTGRPAGPVLESALSADWRRIGEIFVTRGFVTEEELQSALDRQNQTGERLGEALVSLGVITKFELAGALGEQMSSLGESSVGREQPKADVVRLPTREPVQEDDAAVVEGEPDRGLSVVPDTVDEPLPAPVEEHDAGASLEAVPPPGEDEPERGVTARPRPTLGTHPAPNETARVPDSAVRSSYVAFAPTASGYVLVSVPHEPPAVGDVIELDGLGELVVLRHGRSPLPLDERICVIVEPTSTASAPETFSFSN